MPMPITFLDAPTFMGSWPIAPVYGPGSSVVLLPRTLVSKARILGMVKDSTGGYDVVGQSFFLDVDEDSFQVSFTGTGNLSLNEVITQINATSGIPAVAFRDNGFLRLESPTSGDGSYLRVRRDPGSSHGVLYNLGLFSGVESSAGEPVSAPTTEAERQINSPHQMSYGEGESLTTEALNRMAMQLSVNSDVQYGLLSRRPQARPAEISMTDPGDGFVLPGVIYTGTISDPDKEQLFDIVTILDELGNVVVVDVQDVLDDSLDLSFWYDPDDKHQTVECGTSVFDSDDEKDPIYVISYDPALGALAGVPLKVQIFEDANSVQVLNVDPETGDPVLVGTEDDPIVVTGARIRMTQQPVGADSLWVDDDEDDRVENVLFEKVAARAITRIELNNRVVSLGAAFLASGVQAGDKVTLAGHGATSPYSNDGIYRVSRVVDEDTVELVNEEYGPTFLIPSGVMGTIKVETHGVFYKDPWVSISPHAPDGVYRVVYREMSTLAEIMEDPGALTSTPSSYRLSNDATIEKTLMAVLGPSTTNFYQYLHDDARVNLENLSFQINLEHHHDGRHSTIRPDVINMESGVSNATVIVRNSEDDESDPDGRYKIVQISTDDELLFGTTPYGSILLIDALEDYGVTELWGSGFWSGSEDTGTNTLLVNDETSADMFTLYSEDHDVGLTLRSRGYHNHSKLAMDAYGDGDDSRSYIDLWASEAQGNFTSNDTGSFIRMTSGRDPYGTRWVITAKGGDARHLAFSNDFSSGSSGYPNLLYLVNDNKGAAVGIGYDLSRGSYVPDPGYTATYDSRSSLLDVAGTYHEWPMRITRTADSGQNGYLCVRERVGGNPVQSGDQLGGITMGGRYSTSRGAFSMGWNGGAHIAAAAAQNWDNNHRGADLNFYTVGTAWGNPPSWNIQMTISADGYFSIGDDYSSNVKFLLSNVPASNSSEQTGFYSGNLFTGAGTGLKQGIRSSTNFNGSQDHVIGVASILNAYTGASVVSGTGNGMFGFWSRLDAMTGLNTLPVGIHYNAADSVVTGHTTPFSLMAGFSCGDLTHASTFAVGFLGALAAGTGKWNLYMGGTALNYLAGNLGVGTSAPDAQLDAYRSDSDTLKKGLYIHQGSTGDAAMEFGLGAGAHYAVGIDNSDSDIFKITAYGSGRHSLLEAHFAMNSSGLVGIGIDPVGTRTLYINGNTEVINGALYAPWFIGGQGAPSFQYSSNLYYAITVCGNCAVGCIDNSGTQTILGHVGSNGYSTLPGTKTADGMCAPVTLRAGDTISSVRIHWYKNVSGGVSKTLYINLLRRFYSSSGYETVGDVYTYTTSAWVDASTFLANVSGHVVEEGYSYYLWIRGDSNSDWGTWSYEFWGAQIIMYANQISPGIAG